MAGALGNLSPSDRWAGRTVMQGGQPAKSSLASGCSKSFIPCPPSSEAPACEKHLAAERNHRHGPGKVEPRPGSYGVQADLVISR